jgi:hypothetical protein
VTVCRIGSDRKRKYENPLIWSCLYVKAGCLGRDAQGVAAQIFKIFWTIPKLICKLAGDDDPPGSLAY